MEAFKGFPEGKMRLTPIPGPFFTDLLPAVNHLGELKVLLYAFWRLDRMEGAFRSLQREDILSDAHFMHGLGAEPASAEAALDEALDLAVEHQILLRAELVPLHPGDAPRVLYFVNSARGRAAILAIGRGEWRPSGDSQAPIELDLEPPSIFKLYEEHIGPVTPMIAEALQDAEQIYPARWIQDAFRLAVENNKRSWRYAAAILARWQEQGRDERKDRRNTEKDRRRYTDWEDGG